MRAWMRRRWSGEGRAFICDLYAAAPQAQSHLYAVLNRFRGTHHARRMVRHRRRPRSNPMLDIVYILIGAAFLGGCVLYTFACDHL
jgi:hypothetical protein